MARSTQRFVWLSVLVVVTPPLFGNGQGEVAEPVEWWSVNHEVGEQAFHRDIGQWARQLEARPLPDDLGQLVRAFNVFVRAGHDQSAKQAIDRMAQFQAAAPTHLLSEMADHLIGREDWDLALYYVRRIEQAQPGWGYVLIRHWAENEDAGRIDRFLADRGASSDYWFSERIRFRQSVGTIQALIEQLAAEVRSDPSDSRTARRYLNAVRESGDVRQFDVSWLAGVCRPKSAISAFDLAGEARFAPKVAVALLERSLDTPYTDQDEAEMKRRMTMRAAMIRPDPPNWESTLRDWTKRELMMQYKANGQADKAQQLLEELTAAHPDGLDPLALTRTAGQIQAASGARVIQGRIEAAQAANQQNSAYWRGRGEYYAGRQEHDEALSAYQKALEVAATLDEKIWSIESYAGYLERVKGRPAAFDMLWREYHLASEVLYIDRLVRLMGVDFFHQHPQQFWQYLAARTSWDDAQRMIWSLAELEANQGRLDSFWQRAEELAMAPDAPNRAYVLGWIMTRTSASRRAVPLLRRAVDRLDDADQRRSAGFTLFEAYLDTGDWKAAEQVWELARQQLTPNETPQWLGRIAVCAANAGAGQDALRLWKVHANLDRGDFDGLEELIQAGLRQELLAWYKQMKLQDPLSLAPDRAIAWIQSK